MEEEKKEKKTKRFVMELSPDIHNEIRMRSAKRNISMKIWVMRSIQLGILEEDKYK
jgi:predicted HicB family RNase H-like nuclease